VDDVGEASFEAAQGFLVGFAGGAFALRESRCRWTSPEDTSIGATPQNEANADADRNRPAAPDRAGILAARTSPMPCKVVRVVPDAATAAAWVPVASVMRRSRRRGSPSSSTAT
jgi:hypothetical protein